MKVGYRSLARRRHSNARWRESQRFSRNGLRPRDSSRGSAMETVYRSLAPCCHCNARCFSNRRCGPLYGSLGTADSLSANVAVGRQLRAWPRGTNIRTTGGATTTPATTVTQAALRRFTNRESCGRASASTLAQAHKHPHNWRSHDNASFDRDSGSSAAIR